MVSRAPQLHPRRDQDLGRRNAKGRTGPSLRRSAPGAHSDPLPRLRPQRRLVRRGWATRAVPSREGACRMKYVVLKIEDSIDPMSFDFPNQRVVGIFKAPTVYCDNTDGHRGKKTEAGWTRGKKYGWWVCGKCKKPTKAWSENLNAVLGAAKNLLPTGQV